jgi:hypothetical protein
MQNVTRVRLSGGVELWIDANLEDARKAWRRAVAQLQMLEITNDDGNVVAVNPNQVLYLEEMAKPRAVVPTRQPDRVPDPAA